MSLRDVDRLLVVTPGALNTGVIMPVDPSGHNEDHRPGRKPSAQAGVGFTLPEAMTGRASPAKAAVGDKPVFAYIDSLPQPQRGIAEAIDALAAETLPGLQRSVKWGMAYYGVGDGWCFRCGRLRGPCQGHVHQRRGPQASTTDDTCGDGQGDTRCRARVHRGHRCPPARRLDEADRLRAWCRRKETLNSEPVGERRGSAFPAPRPGRRAGQPCALVNAATNSLIALRTLVSAEIHRYAERPQLAA